VRVDGKLIYSKHSTGQFPDEAEILKQLASRR
jgi:predicted Rdx family selenoprotein